jgi:hypothetical protein
MSKNCTLYEAFTGGVLADRWSAGGVQTEYDSVSKDLTLKLPVGWTDLMPAETRRLRMVEWCLDDPTFQVRYGLWLRTTSGEELCRVKLTAVEHDDGTIEFRTGVNFKPLRGVPR